MKIVEFAISAVSDGAAHYDSDEMVHIFRANM